MNNKPSNKQLALVTGSSSGIGLAIAHQLAKSGRDLILHGLETEEQGSILAKQFAASYAINAIYYQCDISHVDHIEQMMQKIAAEVGQIDILVNNAGIQYTAAVQDFPVHKWDQIIAINLSAAFHTTRLVLPGMIQQRWGRIVNIASVHGLVASVNKSAYCAAKHGLVGMTKVLALENAAKGITANCICPGWVDTPLLVEQVNTYAQENNTTFDEAKQGLIKAKAAFPDFIDPEDLGQLAVFLCSDAAKAITGIAMPIDGAWTAQ